MSTSKNYFQGKDMFLLPDGSTYHLEIKEGDVFQRILTVGSKKRAEAISKLFSKEVKVVHSSREFHIYSGYYKDVGITIIAIGMGAPMMDFMMREVTFVQPKPIAIVRLGTCGLFNKDLVPGTVVTSGKGSHYVFTNYPYFYGSVDDEKELQHAYPYVITAAVECDEKLNACVIKALQAQGVKVYDGLNASCETFYSCQGRHSPEFSDQNDDMIKNFTEMNVDSIEMESHQLFHLAKMRKQKCYAAAAAIGIVNRVSSVSNIKMDEFHKIEVDAGRACLDALAQFKFE